jgi:hypothetical protein
MQSITYSPLKNTIGQAIPADLNLYRTTDFAENYHLTGAKRAGRGRCRPEKALQPHRNAHRRIRRACTSEQKSGKPTWCRFATLSLTDS